MDTFNHTDEPLRVVALCGSLRSQSHTRQALAIALEGARERGANTQLIDLRDYDLIFCHGSKTEGDRSSGVQQLRSDIQQAHGIILGTPEYHGSFSGVLKNALDLMGFDELGGKVVGMVGVSGGALGAANALNALRLVGRSLHAGVLPLQVSIPRAWQQFEPNDRPTDPQIEERLTEIGRQVARFAFLHSSKQAQAFVQLWEEATPNPGGDWSENE